MFNETAYVTNGTETTYVKCATNWEEEANRRGKRILELIREKNRLYNEVNKLITKVSIKKVIFNDPATIVFWEDGTKTVVKAQDGEVFDPEKGLAMCFSKKVLGNTGRYYDEFKKWIPDDPMTRVRRAFVKEYNAQLVDAILNGFTPKKEDK